jgi:hypothetical protein
MKYAVETGTDAIIIFLKFPIYLQSVRIHLTNSGKG